jgi:hypothetical protein
MHGLPTAYRMAERVLLDQARQIGLLPPPAAGTPAEQPKSSSINGAPSATASPVANGDATGVQEGAAGRAAVAAAAFRGIYAVGDNPAVDVRGANVAGAPWVSCLVRTGALPAPVFVPHLLGHRQRMAYCVCLPPPGG